ncbi:bifunctional GNAT family N-acetyltransferase/acetate--CoA ligase family protein [Kineosporia sp. A_224]|uniref:bifunctional acetate--CoA ligase family protein/GNAT family N-acetyltransferase n=1 Tax=Kineosporia sp. A_224 TaxID=1962180 RepID=UPI001E4E799C|nr:bifunctional GNAT family N-acetyltransferase/acetate--CoA ligase family protein [Kineosporia sp. A_224]
MPTGPVPPPEDDVPVAYPAHWEADVVLRDGGTAHMRPIRPDDAEALQRFHLAQSPESIYLRFFAPMPRLSDKDLHRFTHVDHLDRVAFVCTVGGEILGVGRYDRTEPTEAEVAFNISDHHHGRGLGSVLLEHLAAAARENGVHRFVAEVLPQNRKMMGVFRDAGYEVKHAFDDGVISLEFDIDPTERSLAVMESREHRAEARSVHALLNPRSVVLVGASRHEGTVGHKLLMDMLAADFTGALHVVHPEADAVLGVPAFRRLADVPPPVDLAIIAVPAAAVLEVVDECAAVGVRGLVVVSAGFAETGPEGLERQRALVRVAREHGMRVVGPNSWGVINADPGVRLNVSLASVLPTSGRFGLFSQSGAISVSVLDVAQQRGVGLSTFVSAGNRADVSGNDCMQYWEEDPGTDVVGLYLESVGNPRKFSRIARRLSRTKPVIVVKSGASRFSATPGHAVRPSRVPKAGFNALLRQSGCIRVDNVRQLFDVAQLVLHQPLPSGSCVAVVANSEALAALTADACVARKLDVVHGPVALPTLAGPEDFRTALEAAFADEHVDAVVTAFMPPVATHAAEVARVLAETSATASIPVVASFLGMSGIHEQLSAGRVVPTYPTPEEAVRALAAATKYGQWRRRDAGPRVDPPGLDVEGARTFVDALLALNPEGLELSQPQAATLLACYGVRLWPSVPVTTAEEAVAAALEVGFPVALKATAPHLRHRVDLGGVRLDIASVGELSETFVRMRDTLGPLGGEDLVVQAMAPTGVACVVRSAEDPLFGPVVSFGLAGDATALLGDWAHRIPPLCEQDVVDLVRTVKAAPKLFGHRGAGEADVDALHDVLARVSCLALDVPEIAELDLNPVVAADRGAAVLGATIRLAPDEGRTDAGVRELTTG